jgi:hypothetical protein
MCLKGVHFGRFDNFSKFYLFSTNDSRQNDKIFDLAGDDVYYAEINFWHVAANKSSSSVIKDAIW